MPGLEAFLEQLELPSSLDFLYANRYRKGKRSYIRFHHDQLTKMGPVVVGVSLGATAHLTLVRTCSGDTKLPGRDGSVDVQLRAGSHVRHERHLALRAEARRPRRVGARRPRVADVSRSDEEKAVGAAARGRRRAVGEAPGGFGLRVLPAVAPVAVRPRARARAVRRGAPARARLRNPPAAHRPEIRPRADRKRARNRQARREAQAEAPRPLTRTIPGGNFHFVNYTSSSSSRRSAPFHDPRKRPEADLAVSN